MAERPLDDEQCDVVQQRFAAFLEEFAPADEAPTQDPDLSFYVARALEMAADDVPTLNVDIEHLSDFDNDVADVVINAHYRVDPYLRKALQNFLSRHTPDFVSTEEGVDREFWVSFHNLALKEKLRDLKTAKIGKLVAFEGTVTRTSEVHPELYMASFECPQCQNKIPNVEQQFKYTQPVICNGNNNTCGNRINFTLKRDESTFVDWQKVKVQESADEVPAGCLPRTMEVILRNNLVESVRAGDKVVFVGNLIVVPDVAVISAPGERVTAAAPGNRNTNAGADQGVTGPKFLGAREMTYRLAFIASSTQAVSTSRGLVNVRDEVDPSEAEVLAGMTDLERQSVLEMAGSPQIYENLAKSLAPGVFGPPAGVVHDIKKAVLLMLVGGVNKVTKEGIKLRSDINVAIVGDPSCGKSQILKYVASFLPRAVFTSGKSSSAAGLTASVVKEADSNDFCIEAGALMLADSSVCCIDEFDKMDVKDQVAIHEAMEQQTISIAKAGIQATLNARTAILAAANPIGGRYDRSKPLRYNVALPPAILSRFDLLHIMVDEPDAGMDREVANHIVGVHMRRDTAFDVPYTMPQIQNYIKLARTKRPELSQQAASMIVTAYKQLRAEDAVPGSSSAYRITVRQLEALVRISEALARLRARDVVAVEDVVEARRLVRDSILGIERPQVDLDDQDWLEDLAQAEELAEAARQAAAMEAAEEAERPRGGADADTEMQDADAGGPASGASPAAPGAEGAEAGEAAAASPSDGEAGAAPSTEELAAEAREAVAEAGAEAAQQAAEAARQQRGTRITMQHLNEAKGLLVTCMMDAERLRTDAAQEGEQGNPMGEDGNPLPPQDGLSQHLLCKAYFDERAAQGKLPSSLEAVEGEAVLLNKIIQHLIVREAIFVVAWTPVQGDEEPRAEWLLRARRERVLVMNPNYSLE